CRPGATGTDLLRAYRAAGIDPPPVPIARGLGLGFDVPIIAADLPDTAAGERLDPGVVFALTSYVWEPGLGAAITTDAVHVTEDGPELLGSSGPSSNEVTR